MQIIKNKKPLARWFGEAMLVFVSVLAAFWVEEYRQFRQQEKTYVNTLLNFRNEVQQQIRDFRYNYDTASIIRNDFHPEAPFELLVRRLSSTQDSLYLKDNEWILAQLTYIGNDQIVKWRNPSIYLDQLYKFPNFMNEDQLALSIKHYESIMNFESFAQDQWNVYTVQLSNYLIMNTNLKNPEQTSLNKVYISNTLDRLKTNVARMSGGDKVNAKFLSNICKHLDATLEARGIDPEDLNTSFILK